MYYQNDSFGVVSSWLCLETYFCIFVLLKIRTKNWLCIYICIYVYVFWDVGVWCVCNRTPQYGSAIVILRCIHILDYSKLSRQEPQVSVWSAWQQHRLVILHNTYAYVSALAHQESVIVHFMRWQMMLHDTHMTERCRCALQIDICTCGFWSLATCNLTLRDAVVRFYHTRYHVQIWIVQELERYTIV